MANFRVMQIYVSVCASLMVLGCALLLKFAVSVINLRHYFDWLDISLDNQEGLHWHSLEGSNKEQ